MKKDLIAVIAALTLYWTGVIVLVMQALDSTLREITLAFSQTTVLGLVFCIAGFAWLIVLLLKKDKRTEEKDNHK